MTTMALFINTGEHPSVFGNEKDIIGKNQSFYRRDHVSELIKKQEQVNTTLLHSLREMTILQRKQARQQEQKWQQSESQLEELKKQNAEQKRFENNTLATLNGLDQQNKKMQTTLENEEQIKREILEQMSVLSESNQYTVDILHQYESFNEHMMEQMNHMSQLQMDVGQKIMEQDDQQQLLNERLENQEALTEKTLRQLDHLRASLFERTNHLVEKIEESYQLTSSYIYHLLKGSNQPFTFLISEERSEDKKK